MPTALITRNTQFWLKAWAYAYSAEHHGPARLAAARVNRAQRISNRLNAAQDRFDRACAELDEASHGRYPRFAAWRKANDEFITAIDEVSKAARSLKPNLTEFRVKRIDCAMKRELAGRLFVLAMRETVAVAVRLG